jgi:hypothetical protein
MAMTNQTIALEQFQKQIQTSLRETLTENDCLRFLRARKWEVDKAVELAEKWYEWYYSPIPGGNGATPANILDKPDPKEHIFKRLTPHSMMGVDKSGHPIYWEMTGLVSTRFIELIKHISLDELVARHVRQQELSIRRVQYQSQLLGHPIEKQICIMNLKDLSYSLDTRALATFHKTLAIDQVYYPERLQYLFMINAPWFFTATWSMIKNWIDPVTADKIKILGSNFLETLKEHIPEDQIPPEFGGTHSDWKWQWPWPEETGISEYQLGYIEEINLEMRRTEAMEEEDGEEEEEQDEEEVVYPIGTIFSSSHSPGGPSGGGGSSSSSLLTRLRSFFSLISIDTLFHIETFHLICCLVSLCICDVYFYFLFSYLWDLTLSLIALSIASQIILYYFWSDGLLLYLVQIFELSL